MDRISTFACTSYAPRIHESRWGLAYARCRVSSLPQPASPPRFEDSLDLLEVRHFASETNDGIRAYGVHTLRVLEACERAI